MDSKHIYDFKDFKVKVYRADKNATNKIVMVFDSKEQTLDHVTIDYFKQEILEECNGINVDDGFIVLNCDIDPNNYKEIPYYIDQNLTKELNDELAPK